MVVVRFERVLTVLRTHVFSQTTRRAHGVKHSTDMRHLPGSIHPCIKATAHDGAPHG